MNLKILGKIGFAILIVVLIYLLLKIFGIIHSAGYEEVLLAVVVGQVFYNGYLYKAVEEIEKRLKKIEEKFNKKE